MATPGPNKDGDPVVPVPVQQHQTRYQFYDADSPEMVESTSKSREMVMTIASSSSSSDSTGGGDGINTGSDEENNAAGSNELKDLDNGGIMERKVDLVKVAVLEDKYVVPEEQEPEVEYDPILSMGGKSTDTTTSDVEDILRSLAETESEVVNAAAGNIISTKKSNDSAVSSGSGISTSVSMTMTPMGRPPMHMQSSDRAVSNATASMTISSPTTKEDGEDYDVDDDNDEEVTALTNPTIKKNTTMMSAHEQLIREAIQHIRRRGEEREKALTTHHHTTHTTSDAPEPKQPLIVPTSNEMDIANATKLDNRLLSPPADVRKAASDTDMFRQTTSIPGEGDNASSGNGVGVGLNLAQPVYSANSNSLGATSHVNGSGEGGGERESPMHRLDFSVVPSSPAPGKFGHHYQHQQSSSHSHGHSKSMEVPKSSNKSQKNKSRQLQLEMERKARREMDIEKGVEQVLVAILQKANNSGNSGNGFDLEQLLGGMFGQSPPLEGERTMRQVRVDSNDDEEKDDINVERTKRTSAVDELLEADSMEDDDVINELSAAFQPVTLSEDADEEEERIAQIIDIVEHDVDEPQDQEVVGSQSRPGSGKKMKTSIRPLSNSIDGLLEVEAVQRDESEHDDTDTGRSLSSDRSEKSASDILITAEGSISSRSHSGSVDEDVVEAIEEMVLGPLSKSGTTGVVLQDDDDDDDDEELNDDDVAALQSEDVAPIEDPDSGPTSPSIMSSVARRTTNILSKLSFGSSPASAKSHSQDDNISYTITSPAKSEKQSEEEFVRDLYAHMMVRHPSSFSHKSTKKDAIVVGGDKKEEFKSWMSDQLIGTTNLSTQNYEWDDEDLDEPGYITHTVSRSKLHQIESVFEGIIDDYEAEFEQEMRRRTPTNNSAAAAARMRKSRSSASPSATANAIDFENDLDQVEKMLAAKKGKLKKKVTPAKKRKGQKTDSTTKTSSNNPENNALATNSLFPGAKAAGEGEVGDLEIYHLPIIYKAHQTGFEPTKDLVLQPDSVFAGQYYVQSELGSAAFSTAYRCVDLNSGKKADDDEIYYDEVCLKVIKNTKDFFDQSLDEIKILELLRQTGECNENNILEMKAFFYHKEHLIIVTELLRQNLFEFGKYITEHDEPVYFTRSRLCYIARQCLVALSFVHKLGLVHSDIKPENILLSSYSRARVKVIDFGSSCYLTDRQSSYIQSRSYRAPEVVLGLPYDGKIDVWSLGCVIAEMYTGQVTFQNDSVVTMLSRIEAICGAFPRNMIEDGRQSGQFFSPTGLLYEKVESDDDSCVRMDTSNSFADDDSAAAENSMFNIFQPKTTTMAERLGFDPDLMERKRKTWEEEDSYLFVDFITKLLTIDPEKRPTADEALEHPWILAGFNLSEDDLKYPPE